MTLEFINLDILVCFKCLSKWNFTPKFGNQYRKLTTVPSEWCERRHKSAGVCSASSLVTMTITWIVLPGWVSLQSWWLSSDSHFRSPGCPFVFVLLLTQLWLSLQKPWLGLCSGYTGTYSGSASAYGQFWFFCLFVCFLRLYFETLGEVSTSGPAQSLEESCKTSSGWGHWPTPHQK